MRATLMGFVVGVGIVAAWFGWASPSQVAYAQRSQALDNSGQVGNGIIAVPGAVVEGQQIVVLIDPEQRSLASYQIDGRTAQITLRCVRNFRWDLQLDDYSGTEPSPEKIQALLRPR
jgi:hypothetical protein